MPELRYVFGTIFLLRLMWTFNKFDDVFLLTSGGFGTRVLPILTYEFSFKLFDFGQGAATAMFLVILLRGLYADLCSQGAAMVMRAEFDPAALSSGLSWRGALSILFPFYWMVASSMKNLIELFGRDPTFFPSRLHLDAYRQLFAELGFGRNSPTRRWSPRSHPCWP